MHKNYTKQDNGYRSIDIWSRVARPFFPVRISVEEKKVVWLRETIDYIYSVPEYI